jgi:hypothetical protein
LAGGAGSRWRARMLRTTSAEWTPWESASAQAASIYDGRGEFIHRINPAVSNDGDKRKSLF